MRKGRLRGLWIAGLASGVLGFSVAAHARLARVAAPEIAFTLIGPAGMKINGTGNQLRVVDDGQSVKITVPLAAMKTGISVRDKHMHEKYLQTPNYPSSELTVSRSALKIPAEGANVNQETTGDLLLHGKHKPVNFRYTCTREGSKLKVHGAMHLNMNEFGIEVPVYLGVTVKPDVDVVANFEVTDE